MGEFGIIEILQLIGGLSLFLYGMNVMGDGLERLGGGKLESLLARLTSTRLRGILLGTIVTAIIQSSSATTVMVVGFVNSGIMKLGQSVGIIIGANIGTAMTAWILSLTGIEGDSLFIQLLKPANFTPVLAAIGIVITMTTKSSKRKNIANILIGFAILMFGMETMSGSVSGLKDNESFTNFLTMFENPILGVIAGTVFTAVIQSSSASVGILQALSVTGSITFGSAIPIILGQNIGTCITVIIASIGASKNAKRAAAVHLYFNIIGTVLCLSVFYLINSFVHFGFLSEMISPLSIAVVHTSFKLITTIVFLPFMGLLEKLARLTIRGGEETDMFSVLDERFFQNPQFALDECTTLTRNMAYIARETLECAVKSIDNITDKIDQIIVDNETQLDKYEDKLGKYLVKMSARATGNHQSRQVTLLLHAISEFERITDYQKEILYTSRAKSEKGSRFSEKAEEELKVLVSAVSDIMDKALCVFTNDDMETAYKIDPLGDVIERLGESLKKRHIARMREGRCTVETGVLFTDYVTSFERISYHCQNIAAFVIQKNDTSYDMHSDAHAERRASQEYKELYKEFKNMYILPPSNSDNRN